MLARPTMTDDEIVDVLLSLDPMRSCAYDVADRGGLSDDEVAEILGLSKQRLQQIEGDALFKQRCALAVLGVRKADVDG